MSEGTPLTEIYEWWDEIPQKYVVLINACCPFVKTETIEGFFNDYLKSDTDGMFAVMDKKNYFWDEDGTFLRHWKKTLWTPRQQRLLERQHTVFTLAR